MRIGLAESLRYIWSEVGSQLDLDSATVEAALERIETHRIKPGIFGRYYRLVLALQQGENSTARKLISEIVDLSKVQPAFSVQPFSDAALGADRVLYAELIDPNPQDAVPLLAEPPAVLWRSFPDKVAHALDILNVADPSLAAELRSLTIEVICAAPPTVVDARPFGSASSFMLWGALLINAVRYTDALAVLEALVHEGAHQLLFAHSIEEPLVTNALSERYASPLRPDPRPMDGVYHATFVTARVHYATNKIRQALSPTFAPADVKTIDDKLGVLKDLYFGGLDTVQRHGKLTATGQRIIEESLDYMKTV